MNMIFRPLTRYVDFQGRSSRAEFWPFFLLIMVIYLGMEAWAVSAGFGGRAFDPLPMMMRFATLLPIMIVFALALFLPTYGLMVRRLHDTNRTGWWVLLPMATNIVGQTLVYSFQGQAIMQATLDMQNGMKAMMGSGDMDFGKLMALEWPVMQITLPWTMAAGLLGYLVLWVLWALPGTPGPNRFGADPKAS